MRNKTMLEVAIDFLKETQTGQKFKDIADRVAEELDLPEENREEWLGELYTSMTLSRYTIAIDSVDEQKGNFWIYRDYAKIDQVKKPTIDFDEEEAAEKEDSSIDDEEIIDEDEDGEDENDGEDESEDRAEPDFD